MTVGFMRRHGSSIFPFSRLTTISFLQVRQKLEQKDPRKKMSKEVEVVEVVDWVYSVKIVRWSFKSVKFKNKVCSVIKQKNRKKEKNR